MKNIRNFCIIAHIDHGKSTLADRLLEMTGTVEKRKMKEQLLDTMDLERERGITIKMTPIRMQYTRHFDRGLTQTKMRTLADKMSRINEDEGGLLYKELTYAIRGSIFNVFNTLGSGHKESFYGNALEKEFLNNSIKYEREKTVNIFYGDDKVGTYRPDFIIENKIILELKALPFIGSSHKKQIWHYLNGSDYRLAMLVNFGGSKLQIERVVYDSARNNQNIISENPRTNPRQSAKFTLNLIDTPGHVDFGYEVSRSLAAVEGAVLLVDATKGVQAQTLANLYQAIENNLEIIPVVNKIDLPNANVEKTKNEIVSILGCKKEEIILASGKTGAGVKNILEAIVEKVPPPTGEAEKPLRALVFDSKYDSYKGVLAFVRIVDGEVSGGDELLFMINGVKAEALEVGKFKPELSKEKKLSTGQIGYIATGLKSVEECRVGDTITSSRIYAESTRIVADRNSKSEILNSKPCLPAGRQIQKFNSETQTTKNKLQKTKEEENTLQATSYKLQASLEPLPGYKEVSPMVYASFYPTEGEDYNQMRDALDKLKLNDASLVFEGESSLALGRGFRLGFLGLLHLEIIQERLKREFGFNPTITTPSVVYEVKIKGKKDKVKIYSASDLPDASNVEAIGEPRTKLEILTPNEYLGSVMKLVNETTRSRYISTEYIDKDRVSLKFNSPLSEIIVNFHDALKSVSKGFASMNYELVGYEVYDLVRLDVYVAEERIDAFSQIVPKEKTFFEGRKIVKKLKEVIPRQNFSIKLQATIGAKVIARETISAFRKDVTGHLYGGDITRKRKLLEKQKKGKKRMGVSGKAHIPQEVFLKILKN